MKHEPNDVLETVGIVRSQEDRYRIHGFDHGLSFGRSALL